MGQSFSVHRGGRDDGSGSSGHTGLVGASERSELESESESEADVLEGRREDNEVVGRCVGSMGLSGASERSSSESARDEVDIGFEVAGGAKGCS